MKYDDLKRKEMEAQKEALFILRGEVEKGSQILAGRKYGVSQTYIHDLLHGTRKFSGEMLKRILG